MDTGNIEKITKTTPRKEARNVQKKAEKILVH